MPIVLRLRRKVRGSALDEGQTARLAGEPNMRTERRPDVLSVRAKAKRPEKMEPIPPGVLRHRNGS